MDVIGCKVDIFIIVVKMVVIWYVKMKENFEKI